MNEAAYLQINPNLSIAYHSYKPNGDATNLPGIIFLGGFRSDMTGNKALYLENWAKRRGHSFVRFDYRGHGQSSGALEDGSIGDWADDAAAVLQRVTQGRQILVGSSMGGWIACLLARRFPECVAGLIGIASAPDFTEDLLWAALDDRQRAELFENGFIERASAYSEEPYRYTRRLIEDGRQLLVLRAPLKIDGPVRLLHGTADMDVDVTTSIRLLEHLRCSDARLTLVKNADHRFSDDDALELIGKTLHDVVQRVAPADQP